MLADVLPFAPGWQKKFRGLYACMERTQIPVGIGNTCGEQSGNIHFLKPQTYMNLSGEPVGAAASFFKINTDEILVVHDEIELPFGTVSLKFSGGLGGHNGLRSLKACLGSADFWRLRLGIGRPDGRIPGKGGSQKSSPEQARLEAGIADWVLSDFTSAEAEALAPVFKTAAGLLVQAINTEPVNLLPEWAKKNCLV